MFCFFPANFMSNLFKVYECLFPIGKFLTTVLQKYFSNSFFHTSLAKRWPYRFRSKGTTGAYILDHDLGHLCRGRRIQMSGHSDLDFSVIWEHLPFLFGKNRYCDNCFTCKPWKSGDDIHDLSCCNLRCWRSLFSEYCVRPWFVFYNIPRVQLDLKIFGALPSIQHFSDDMCPLMMQNELQRRTSLLHRSPFSYFWL